MLRGNAGGASLDGVSGGKRGAQGQDAPSHAFAGLQYGHLVPGPEELVGSDQTGHAGTDHDNPQRPVGWGQHSGSVFGVERARTGDQAEPSQAAHAANEVASIDGLQRSLKPRWAGQWRSSSLPVDGAPASQHSGRAVLPSLAL